MRPCDLPSILIKLPWVDQASWTPKAEYLNTPYAGWIGDLELRAGEVCTVHNVPETFRWHHSPTPTLDEERVKRLGLTAATDLARALAHFVLQ